VRLCQRVRFSIFLCFFLRMRLRRFLISDPMATETLADRRPARSSVTPQRGDNREVLSSASPISV
jgi:hypothetical protein